MTAYEEAIRMQKVVKEVVQNIYRATGRNNDGETDTRNDKATFRVSAGQCRSKPEIVNGDWSHAKIYLYMSYGYFGSSSGYTAIDEDTADYVVRAIQSMMPLIADKAINLAKKDLADAKAEARAEAEKVLAEIEA